MAAPGERKTCLRRHLGLGDTFREALSVSPMYMDFGNDLIWAGTGSRAAICASFTWTAASAFCRVQIDLLPAGSRLAPRMLSVIGHGEFRLLLRQNRPDRAGRP